MVDGFISVYATEVEQIVLLNNLTSQHLNLNNNPVRKRSTKSDLEFLHLSGLKF